MGDGAGRDVLDQQLMTDLAHVLRPVPDEVRSEAEWILRHVYETPALSKTDDPVLRKVLNPDRLLRDRERTLDCMENALTLLRWEQHVSQDKDVSGPREVPFIARYRKDAVGFPEVLTMHGLPSSCLFPFVVSLFVWEWPG